MSNIRDLGGKINSLKNMQKVMRAMNMISSIKLRKLYTLQDSLTLFSRSVDKIYLEAVRVLADSSSPLAAGYKDITRVHIIMFTADKGLCGTHNSSIQKAVSQLIEENKNSGIELDVTCIGNKGIHFCKRKGYEIYQQSEIGERVFNKEQLKIFSDNIMERFLNNEVQKVVVIGNMFYSTLHQETETKQILPFFIPERDDKEDERDLRFMTEPEGDLLAESVSRRYLYYKLQSVLLNSYLSEHSSRMTAMENATNNSEDLINKYISMQNHARQSAITNELIEIVSGKEALKG